MMRKYELKPMSSMTLSSYARRSTTASGSWVAPALAGALEGEVAQVVAVAESKPSGSGKLGSCGLPKSISTSARSAIQSVLSHASGTSSNSERISPAVLR